MNIDTILSDKFGIEPMENDYIITGELLLPETKTDDETVQYDYDKTRNNLHTLLDQGQDALSVALNVAKQTEHPRAFEVVSNMIKQLADINLQLLDLAEKKQALMTKKEEPTQITNNNAIFVGSTTELFRALKNS